MIIFAHQDDFGWFSTGSEYSPIVLDAYSSQTEIDTIVSDIYDTWTNNDGNIDCLFLVGHGNAGVLWLGSGLGPVRSAKFSKLRGCFSPNSRGIEIHGCACASGTDISRWHGTGTKEVGGKGYVFLSKLAVNAGVPVTAPIDSVWGFNAANKYDIRTMTVFPHGSCVFQENE